MNLNFEFLYIDFLDDIHDRSDPAVLPRVRKVRKWLFPAIDPAVISDQSAFKPTGSTTIALTFYMHHVTRLLEEHSYVRYLLVDFTKAFDIVYHGILASKLAQLNIPPSILHWIMSFLTDRTQKVKFADYLSSFRPINRE